MRTTELLARAINAAKEAEDSEFSETAKAFKALARYLGQMDLSGPGDYYLERTMPPISDRTIPPLRLHGPS